MKIIRNKELIVALNEEDAEIMGTSLQGEMVISYTDIVRKIGKPTSKGDQYKVSAEWDIHTPYGMGTVYDYKECKKYCGKDGTPTKEITMWHIGGTNQETAQFIKSIFFN
jgi:hypothetical protein